MIEARKLRVEVCLGEKALWIVMKVQLDCFAIGLKSWPKVENLAISDHFYDLCFRQKLVRELTTQAEEHGLILDQSFLGFGLFLVYHTYLF